MPANIFFLQYNTDNGDGDNELHIYFVPIHLSMKKAEEVDEEVQTESKYFPVRTDYI